MTFQSFLGTAWSIFIFYSYLPFVFSVLILFKNIVPLGPSLTAIYLLLFSAARNLLNL